MSRSRGRSESFFDWKEKHYQLIFIYCDNNNSKLKFINKHKMDEEILQRAEGIGESEIGSPLHPQSPSKQTVYM